MPPAQQTKLPSRYRKQGSSLNSGFSLHADYGFNSYFYFLCKASIRLGRPLVHNLYCQVVHDNLSSNCLSSDAQIMV